MAMMWPRAACVVCGKDVAMYDVQRRGWKTVSCEPFPAPHKCPHGATCFGKSQSSDCAACATHPPRAGEEKSG